MLCAVDMQLLVLLHVVLVQLVTLTVLVMEGVFYVEVKMTLHNTLQQ